MDRRATRAKTGRHNKKNIMPFADIAVERRTICPLLPRAAMGKPWRDSKEAV
jgi:hypothetical protein